jgi:hypothetical protein
LLQSPRSTIIAAAAPAFDPPRQGDTMRQARERGGQVGMPRRFGIATLMIITAAIALLCGLLKTFGATPLTHLLILGFVAWVAVCQAVLFKGEEPRGASIVGGVVFGAIVALGSAGWQLSHGEVFPTFILDLVLNGVCGALFGGLWGYLVGCLFAAIFLVRKEPDDAPPEKSENEEL